MSAPSQRTKRKNKKKYFQAPKKHKSGILESGLRGFLITGNNEHKCVKEAYNLLNEYADEMYGNETQTNEVKSALRDLDLEAQLAKEIENVKCQQRRFQQVYTNVKDVIFIKTTLLDPTALVESIFDSILRTGKRKTRFIQKLKPVVFTCKAFEDDIRKSLDEYLLSFLNDEKNVCLTYSIDCKIRYNSNTSSSHIKWYVRKSVEKSAPKWTPSLIDPDIMIFAHVLCTSCCISVLKNYTVYKKYNLSEVANLGSKMYQKMENAATETIASAVGIPAEMNPKTVEIHAEANPATVEISAETVADLSTVDI
ncbi:THUMP domain-containing protein 1-like [Stegodyphus dumicola]|uniref:THUMP domain-containing protein 1-like n=1 Tax=Stegodyphus dumicola TaxID=202533 RepID=UPI0015ABF1CD|nr:THUMP domain-containing protein 1-like [Stegodyphus dumicola]